jgi:hypothetical protein
MSTYVNNGRHFGGREDKIILSVVVMGGGYTDGGYRIIAV